MPLVSVIMPSYQHDRFIAEAIDSVLNQTMGDLELIIVDDGSKDRSQQIIQSYAEKDNRVIPIIGDVNRGIPQTLNVGIDAAKGKFVAFLDADDCWLPKKLEVQLEILENNEDLVVWSEGTIIDANGKSTGMTFTKVHGAEQRTKSGNIFNELLKGNFIFASSRIVKRSNIHTIRFNEDLEYNTDHQFAVDLAWKYHYYFIPEPLSKYRIHSNNTIKRDVTGKFRDHISLGRYFLSKYGDVMENQSRLTIYDRGILYTQRLMDNGGRLQMERTLSLQLTQRFHRIFIERFFPDGTKQRWLYNIFLEKIRRIFR